MEQNIKEKVESLLENVSSYVEQRKDLFVLDAAEKTSSVISWVVAGILVAVLGGLVLLFVSIGAAWMIGQSINNMPMGFLIIAGLYVVVLVIVLIIRKSVLQLTLINYFIKKIYANYN